MQNVCAQHIEITFDVDFIETLFYCYRLNDDSCSDLKEEEKKQSFQNQNKSEIQTNRINGILKPQQTYFDRYNNGFFLCAVVFLSLSLFLKQTDHLLYLAFFSLPSLAG